MKRFWIVGIVLVAYLWSGVAGEGHCQASAPAERLFAYDASAPFELRDSVVRTFEGGVVLHEVSFASPRGGRVHAYMVVPVGGRSQSSCSDLGGSETGVSSFRRRSCTGGWAPPR